MYKKLRYNVLSAKREQIETLSYIVPVPRFVLGKSLRVNTSFCQKNKNKNKNKK